MQKIITIRVFLILLSGFNLAIAKDDEGLAHYKNNNFDEAQKYYESILREREENPSAHFGRGTAAHQQGDYTTAMEAFENTLATEEPTLKAKAFYNMGNTLYQQQRYEESLAFFKKGLELNPTDMDAKYNYELLKYQMQPQPQKQPQEGDQEKDQDNKQKDQSENNQQQSQKDQQQNDKQQQQDQSDSAEQQEQQQTKGQEKEPVNERQEEQQTQAEPNTEDQEEKAQEKLNAEAILDALKNDEKILQKRQIARAISRKLEKDW